MKIAIITLGTRGDLQPYLALGLGLQQAGHAVQLISSKNEADFVSQYGLPYHALSVDIQQAMASRAGQKMAKGDNPLAFIISHLTGSDTMKKAMVAVQEEIWQACQGADALIYHPGMANAFYMAKVLDIPCILASPFPLTQTRTYPAILFYAGPRLGAWYNQLTHFIFDHAFWLLSRSSAQAFWQKQGKASLISREPVSRLQVRSGMPVLYGYSSSLFPRPTDWPANVHVTGTWSLPPDPTWTPPIDLVRFLEAGDRPIYIGFGSLRDTATFKKTLELIDRALLSNQRAVVSLGQSSGLPPSMTDRIFLIDSVPHSWLFGQVAAVVHHGGAGTTATGLLAGRPTLIIPHTADQPAWGQRVYELGVGPKPIPRKKLTADRLVTGLIQLADHNIVERAVALGQKMQTEHGVQQAVQLINDYFEVKK